MCRPLVDACEAASQPMPAVVMAQDTSFLIPVQAAIDLLAGTQHPKKELKMNMNINLYDKYRL